MEKDATNGALHLEEKYGRKEYCVTCEQATGLFYRSKIITFVERYTLTNNVGMKIYIRQVAPDGQDRAADAILPAGATEPFHWPVATKIPV